MVNKFKENWFGILIITMVLFVLLLVAVVSVAPHNDENLRGFTPCTIEMAEKLSFYGANKDVLGTTKSVLYSYVCYLKVIKEGAKLWAKGEQQYPWDNYWFETKKNKMAREIYEPLSDELIEDSKKVKENYDMFNVKENDDE